MSVDAANDDLQAQLREALAALADRDAVIEQRDAQIAEMSAVGVYRAARIKVLEAQLAAMNRAMYGRRSEQLDPAQRQLFEEALHVAWTFAVYNLIRIGGIEQWWEPAPT